MGSKSKIVLTHIKRSDQYDNWRYILQANVCAHDSVENAREALKFLKEVEDTSVTNQSLMDDCPERFQKLDMCLFLALITTLSSSVDGDQVLSRVRAQVEFGCGRQGLRVIDKFYLHEQSRAKTKALQSLMNLECRKIADLGGFLAKFMQLANEAKDVAPAMKVELLKRQLLKLSQLDAVFAVWKKGDFPDFDTLLEALEEYAQERREVDQVRHSHATGQGGDRCNWCKTDGHRMDDCPKYAADIASGKALSKEDCLAQKAKGKGGKGEGKGRRARVKEEGAHKPF